MRNLTVKITDSAAIDWSVMEKAPVDIFKWGTVDKPETYAQMAYAATGDETEGLYIHFACRESNPLITYKNHNEPVYKDSCMECFFTMKAPGAPDNGYINIECNANPTTLIAYGHDRYDRTPIVELGYDPFAVTVKKTDEMWELFEFVPVKVLKEVFKLDKIDENTVLGANFYKCGGDHEILPYGMWSEVDTPAPDFHRSEFFGKLTLAR